MIQAVSTLLSSHILSLIDSEANMVAGGWVAHQEATMPTVSLEVLEKRLNGKEKELFLAFIMSMLKWLPEERKTAKQLLEHPFLVDYSYL